MAAAETLEQTAVAASVRLTQLGHPSVGQGELRLRCDGLPESARQRLVNIGAVIVEEEDDAAVDATVVSTRLAPDELHTYADLLAARVGRTIVLAHTGAERQAADLVRAGADAVVGEGNEEALLGLIDDTRTPNALLASFERRFGAAAGSNARGRDGATGLPDRRSFERRIGSLADADESPRIAYCKVVSERWSGPNPDAIVAVQRRRLAVSLAHVCHAANAELYAVAGGEFGLISDQLSPHDMERLGRRLVATTATFRDRGLPLRLVVGYAGPESATDSEELLDLARRAVDVAASDGTRQVLGAEDLALGVSVTTELEAVMRLLDQIEPMLPEGRGHGERVGNMAAQIARIRGLSPAAVARVQLAGHLHDVGRSGLPAQAIGGPSGLSGELLEAWRTFPVRSAELLQLTAGPAVAEAVLAQRERWDGDGFPHGIRGAEIPESARIVAVAQAIDELIAVERMHAPAALVGRLQERADTELDPEVTGIAIEHLATLLALRST
ncbi:MAG: HD domain-containing protein [Nitriliruptoraceae bacterium]|nr:HD domain-containing protein [Nitriliruptoraceae bacterium]